MWQFKLNTPTLLFIEIAEAQDITVVSLTASKAVNASMHSDVKESICCKSTVVIENT